MIKVFLVDDHAMFRAGIKLVLGSADGIQVVGEAGDGWDLLRALESPELRVDVVLLDLSMPRLNGLEVLARLRDLRPTVAALVISMPPEELYASQVIAAGGSGYLSKGSSEQLLIEAVRTVAAGRLFLSRPRAAAPTGDRARHLELSARETQIFMLLIGHRAVSDIAAELDLAMSTVSTYVGRIRTKLGVSSVGEIIAYAHREGLVE